MFWGLVECHNARPVSFNTNILLGCEVICHKKVLEISKKGPGKSLKSPSWKRVRTLSSTISIS